MNWKLKLNGEGYYWYEAKLPRGRICDVEFDGDKCAWVAHMYDGDSVHGSLIASHRDREVCKENAIIELRAIGEREAKEWAGALK